MSTAVFLPIYSSGNIKLNSIQPVSACLAFFQAIWHFLFTWTWQPWSSVLALVWSTPVLAAVKGCWRGLLVNLHAPPPFAQIGQGYLRRDLIEGILLHFK